MKKKIIAAADAVGQLLCHDITMIEKDNFKGARFKKGHCVREEDLEILRNLGKNHLYILELEAGDLHENEAGERIARAITGQGLKITGPSEGRLDLEASDQGLLKIDVERLTKINSIPDVIVSTIHNYSPLRKGEKVAGAKVIPLVVSEETVKIIEEICAAGGPLISVLPYQAKQISGIITGREVMEGRVKDGFAPVLAKKAATYNLPDPTIDYVGDDAALISSTINDKLAQGSELIVVTGGMSVDPDDVTPKGIKDCGAEIIKYGAPVLPGAMFLLAYKGRVPIIGLPACAMYYDITIFDLILPRLLAGEKVSAADIAVLGHGGFCRRCEPCVYPDCAFGKGCY